MSINNQPFVTALAVKMLSGRTRLIGMPKEKNQFVVTLPNINDFNNELYEAIEFCKERVDCFIITSSTQEECQGVIKEYELEENLISTDFEDYSKIFNTRDDRKKLKRSLMIIDTHCQIKHKDII
jgi:hypothetical protein